MAFTLTVIVSEAALAVRTLMAQKAITSSFFFINIMCLIVCCLLEGMPGSNEEGGAAGVVETRWRTIGSSGVAIVEGCTHEGVQMGAWEEEIVLQLQAKAILLGCQVLIVVIEESLHRGRLRLFGAGRHERTIVIGVARTSLVTTIQCHAEDATQEIQIARHTGYDLTGVQLLLTIVGIEVGCDVTLLPVVACGNGPCGQLVANTQVQGVVDVEVAPTFLATFRRVVVFVVSGAILVGQSAIGVDAIF